MPTSPPKPPDAVLTPRQLEVLELMAKGLTNKEIGGVLEISPGTAKLHVAAVIKALDVTNRTEATNRLHELGLGTRDDASREEFKVQGFGNRPAIAVLPFDNFSTDPEHDHLANGIVEDLTTGLANWRWFPVISRNSAFTFKGQTINVQEVSRALGAGYVIEGSLRVAGPRLRITVQVLEGVNGHHVWAEQFECDFDGLFEAVDRIVEQIISSLEPALVRIGGLRTFSRHPDQLDAWESTTRGFFHLSQNTFDGFEKAGRAYDRAIALDPLTPAPHSGLAYCRYHFYTHRVEFGALHQPQGFGESADLVGQLDPLDPETHFAIAMLRLLDGDRVRGLAAAERAVELGPSDPATYRVYGWALCANDRPSEALAAVSRCLRLSPMDPQRAMATVQVAGCQLQLGQIDEAKTACLDAIRDAPNLALPYSVLAIAHVLSGEIEEARSRMAQMQELAGRFSPLRAVRVTSTERGFAAAKAALAKAGWTEAEFE